MVSWSTTLVRAAGFTVVRLKQVIDEQALEDATTLKLSARYRSMAREEVAVTSTFLVARAARPHEHSGNVEVIAPIIPKSPFTPRRGGDCPLG